MNRRDLLSTGAGLTLTGFPFRLASSLQVSGEGKHAPDERINRRAVCVRSGFTRKPDGTEERAPSPSGMFDTEVVRSADSEGRLAIYVFPAGEHHAYAGAPLHVHHKQDEWIHVMEGDFVAEVAGNRFRLKRGDSLLMPMGLPHRWSVAQAAHCGAIHLYSPAGLMELDWSPVARDEDPKNLEARKAEFERHGLSLLGGSLTKEEINSTL
jgi:mannose-6-phosphate isomerase-like protein (cupin superfamily)